MLVSDQEILAVRALILEEGIVAEPSGAAALAAAAEIRERLQGQKVIVTVTGGNIELSLLARTLHG